MEKYENQINSDPASQTLLPTLQSIILLSFDNEVGQIVENEYPKDQINKQQLKLISIMGFPETNNIAQEGELGFVFKVRADMGISLKCHLINDHLFYYCSALFLQIKSKDSKRGYSQKSIIVVTKELNKYFIFKILYLLKEVLLEKQRIPIPVLEYIFNTVNGLKLEGNEVNNSINIRMFEQKLGSDAIKSVMISKDEKNEFEEKSLVSTLNSSSESKGNDENFEQQIQVKKENESSEINFYYADYPWTEICRYMTCNFQFNNFLETFSLFYVAKLWQIWELIVLEYPIIVYSDNASRVSNIVFLLQSITSPLPLKSDVRPYFSIYDTDFKEYKEEQDLRHTNSAILGVINPIFTKLIDDWPVVLRFDDYFFQTELKTKVPSSPLNSPLSSELKQYYESKVKKSSTLYEVSKYLKKKRAFNLKSNSQIISLFFDCLKTQGHECYDKLNCHLRMYFSELTKDFMKVVDDFVLLSEVKTIRRIALQKKDFSIFEIFNKTKFIKYLKEKSDKLAFNYKYLHDKKKLVTLYTEYLDTKCFRNQLNNLLSTLKSEVA